LNVARALGFQANLPLEFWAKCVLIAAYLINRAPSSVLNGKIPCEVLFKTKPSYEHIKVFRCLCYIHNPQKPKGKFRDCSRRCIFVGYPYGKKGGKVYDLEHNTLIVSQDVIFWEEILLFPNELVEIEKDEWCNGLNPIIIDDFSLTIEPAIRRSWPSTNKCYSRC